MSDSDSFTPGPWTFALHDDSPNEAFVHWPYGYAVVHGSRHGREANARLISAAPELYEALKEMVDIAELTIGWLPVPPDADGPLIKARAALAKAGASRE